MSKRRLNSISQDEIERWITAPRFQAFLNAAGGDRTQAMALYDWNTTCMPAVFFETGDRKEVSALLSRLNPFRNRLAHHEPIIDASVADRYDDLIELAQLVDEDAARWLTARSSVVEILDWRPPLSRSKRVRARLGLTPRTVRFHLHV